MKFIYFKSPFAAFRFFQNIEMSRSADFLTHSAAYGLLLGLAGINRERKSDAEFIGARIALGLAVNEHDDAKLPTRGRCYQQLHWVPQQETKKRKKLDERSGTKCNVRTVWREYLHKLEGYIALDHLLLEALVERGINEPATLKDYWGLPFMGDNNFFIERLTISENPPRCRWLCPFGEGEPAYNENLYFLSVWTDYKNDTQSKSLLFSLQNPSDALPSSSPSWVVIGRS